MSPFFRILFYQAMSSGTTDNSLSASQSSIDFGNVTTRSRATDFLAQLLGDKSDMYTTLIIESGFEFADDFDMYEESELHTMGFKKVHARKIKFALQKMMTASNS